MASFDWNEQAVRRLREMWTDIENSASVIGRDLGVSRSAVIGKAHRLGLPAREPVKRKDVQKAVEVLTSVSRCRAQTVKPACPPVIEVPAPVLRADGTPVTLLNVTDGECHWPLGAGADGQLCGHEVARGCYCAVHAAIAFEPRPVRRDLDRKLGIPSGVAA